MTNAYYPSQGTDIPPTKRPVPIYDLDGEHISEEKDLTEAEVRTWLSVTENLPKHKYKFTEVKKVPKLKGAQ